MWLCTIIKALSTSQVLILCINALLVGRQDELFYLHCYVYEYLVDWIAQSELASCRARVILSERLDQLC